MQLKSGQLVKGKYEVLSAIGEGGFGYIYLARDLDLERTVVLKIAKFEAYTSEQDQVRFQREAKLVAQLSHPNIVRVYSIDYVESGKPFIAMEYLEGTSLLQILQESHCGLQQKQCLKLFEQICQGLAYAHKSGVLHRDLSAANIIVTGKEPEQITKIIDFGLGKKTENSPDATNLTRTHELLGNPCYMSPEACRGEKVNKLHDIYSLGVVLYEMLTGSPPFEASNPISLLYLHLNEFPREPQISWKDNHEAQKIKNIALKCLQKDKENRFQNVDEIISLLNGQTPLDDTGNISSKRLIKRWGDHSSDQAGTKKSPSILFSILIIAFILAASCVLMQLATKKSPANIVSQKPPADAEGQRIKEQAERLIRHSLSFNEATDRSMAKNIRDKLITSAEDLEGKNDLGETERVLLHLLTLSRKAFGSESIETEGSLASLAAFYVRRSNLEKAEPLYEQALTLTEKLNGPASTLCAERLIAIAGILSEKKEYEQAILVQSRALKIKEQLYGKDSEEANRLLRASGGIYRSAGKLKEAEAACTRAIELRRSLFDRMQKREKAARIGHRSMVSAIDLSHDPQVTDRLAGISTDKNDDGSDLCQLALIKADLHKFSEAEQLAKEALIAASRRFGEFSTFKLEALHTLGKVYSTQKKYAEAEKYYEQSLAGAKRHGSLTSQIYEMDLLLETYRKQKKFSTELELAKAELENQEKQLKSNDPALTKYMSYLATAYEDLGRTAEAEKVRKRIQSIEAIDGNQKGQTIVPSASNDKAKVPRSSNSH